MKKETYQLIENYMLSCMDDSSHDQDHIYRVLYTALDIARTLPNVDYDILITACLLHDIGRKDQFEDPTISHAQAGADKAYHFLTANHFDEKFATHVHDCIRTHSYRDAHLMQSIEAKILFDADKIDVTGAIGIARTLLYKGKVAEPLYSLLPDGKVSDGSQDSNPSFLQEYKYKLESIYTQFFTERGMELAKERQCAAVSFYQNILGEINSVYQSADLFLNNMLESNNSSTS